MDKFYLSVLLTFAVLCARNSSAMTLKGIVISEDSTALGGASCVVCQQSDSSFIAGSATDVNGKFDISYNQPGKVFLKVSSIGYTTRNIEIPENITGNEKVDLGTIFMHPQAGNLGEVIVKSEKPVLTVNDGVLTYDVAPLLKTRVLTSAHDLLRELPLITCRDGNNLVLTGSVGQNTIYINGRKSQMGMTQLIDYLKTVPAEKVEKVEIIYVPTAKWKTKMSIINVVINRQSVYTFNGQVRGSMRHAGKYSGGGGASLFLGLPKLTANASYSFYDSNTLGKDTQYGRHRVNETVNEIRDTSKTKSWSQSHNVYLSANYEFNKTNNLELTYNGYFFPKRDGEYIQTNTVAGASLSRRKGDSRSHGLSLTFINNKLVTLGAEYMHYDEHRTRDLKEDRPDSKQKEMQTTVSAQKADIAKAYADFTHTLRGGWRLSGGLSYSYTGSDNDQSTTKNGTHETESYTPREHQWKVYTGINKSFFQQRLSVEADFSGEFFKSGEEHNNAFLPVVIVTAYPSKSHIFQASYSSSREFPTLWQRQKFTTILDTYNKIEGNPELRPATYRSGRLLYVLKNKYTFLVQYAQVNDYFLNQIYQSPDELVQIIKQYNIKYYRDLTFYGIIPLNIGNFYYCNLSTSLSRMQFKSDDWHSLTFDKKRWVFLINVRNTFILSSKPRITAEVTAGYRTPTLVGIWERGDAFFMDCGFGCSLLNDKLSIRVDANDIFESYSRSSSKLRVGDQYLDYRSNYYNRVVSLSLSYRFSGYTDRRKKEFDSSRLGVIQ